MVVALASWVVLTVGPGLAPDSTDRILVEAGDGVGVFAFVFLPWSALTMWIVVVSLLGVLLRAIGVAAVLIAATTVTFGLYLLTYQEMLDAQPALAAFLWFSILFAVVAIVFAGLAAAARPQAGTSAATPSVRGVGGEPTT